MKSMKRATGWVVALCMALAATGAWAQAANTLQVNVGESTIVKVGKVAKLAVADPAVADVAPLSEREVSVIGKKVGITTLTVVHEAGEGKEPEATKVYRVEVGNDTVIGAIRNAISTGAVSVRVIGETLVLEGQVETELEAHRAEMIAKAFKPTVANMIEIKNPRQVKIRVRVAEVNITAVRSMGLKLLGDKGQVQYGFNLAGADNTIAPILHGFVPGVGGPGQVFGADATLQMLEQKGYAKLLSEPTLLTRSGTEASFLAGSEIPIVQTLANATSVEYKEVGVRMKIKPVADSQNRITTVIHAEVSQVTSDFVRGGGGAELPIINTRRADTTLQLQDGQTFIIGGLLDNNIDRDTLRKFPWLGDIPVVGALFRHKEKNHTQRELVFFLTPSVVKDPAAEAAQAARTPLMQQWNGDANKKVLEVPDPKKDWGLHDPQNWGIPKQESAPTKPDAGPDKAKEPVKNYTPSRPAAR